MATIEHSSEPQWIRVTADGHDAVLFQVYQQPSGNTVEIARGIKAKLRGIEKQIPDGVKIADWYVNETLRLQQGGRTDPMLVRAQKLLDWLRTRGSEVDVRDIITFGPPTERSKKAAEQTLAILRSHGWVKVISKRPYRISVVQASTQGAGS